ncbi:MAG: DUF3108 domain-containing protein [Pseudomonadota bacterium]
MAGGLKRVLGATPSWRRRGAAIALVVGVIVLHGWVTQGVMDGLAGAAADRDLPARMEVAYVRQMELTAPPPTAAPAAPPAPPPAAVAPRPRRPKPAKPASAPEPRREVEPVVVAEAASAPVAEAAVEVEATAPAASVTEPSEQVAAAAPPAPAASGGGAPFEWPASTRMSYVLTGNYRGEVSGTAQVEWIRIGSRYQVHVDFVVGPSFAPLITQRSSSDGEITAAGLAPRRYDQDIKFLTKTRPRQTILFDAGGVVLANGDVRPSLPGLQDTASQFVQLTYVFSTRPEMLKVGGSVDIPLALPKKVAVWTYDVVEEETLNTSFGPITGIHLKPRNPDQKAGSLSVEMWMSPQLRYLPVRLRFEQDAQTYVDLMIAKPPEIQ